MINIVQLPSYLPAKIIDIQNYIFKKKAIVHSKKYGFNSELNLLKMKQALKRLKIIFNSIIHGLLLMKLEFYGIINIPQQRVKFNK